VKINTTYDSTAFSLRSVHLGCQGSVLGAFHPCPYRGEAGKDIPAMVPKAIIPMHGLYGFFLGVGILLV
jgi:hypothetical protein